MIKFENTEVVGWEPAIRGMRNPMNSWAKSDSQFDGMDCSNGGCSNCQDIDICEQIGKADLNLMRTLNQGGPVHAKYRRMITVYVDITAPLYWWKEMDTHKVGTVANSCSTMHKIAAKEFTLDDFSCEHLDSSSMYFLEQLIRILNENRERFVNFDKGDKAIQNLCGEVKKDYWWQMIQLLPSSYNQKRTVMLNYEVLSNIYNSRRFHKLDEWSKGFMDWIKTLPYPEIIMGETVEEANDGE